MNCPNRNTLLAFRTGELSEATADEIIPHISACPDCQGTLQTFGDADDTLIAKLRSPAAADPYADEPQRAELMARAMAIVTGDLPVSDPRPAETPEPAGFGRLGEYELLAKLGEGGMGTVYKARQTRLKKIVALKVLSKERTTDPRAVTRFEREMEAVGQLVHPNIVQAFDARDIETTTVLVMEYVDGQDLTHVLKCIKPLRIPDACELIRQAAVGLQYAHEHGLVHRDIKPSNLMLTRQGEVKILDLGLALLNMDQQRGGELTSSGQPMGTADYIAPEQVSDAHSVDIRADIYSLGCTLYKLLTGHSPFSAPQYKTHAEKLVGHLKEIPPPVQQLRTDVSAELAAVIARMMAKSPADRFATPVEVAAAMAPFAAGSNLVQVATEVSAAARDAKTLERAVAITDSDPRDGHGSPHRPLGEGRGDGGLAASPPRRRWRLALAAGGAAAAIFLGIVFLVSTGKGTVKLEFADADAAKQCTVSIDGDEIRIEKLGEPIKLRPGRHQLRILRGDLEIEAREFNVLWRGTQVLHVSIPARPGEVATAGPPGAKQPDDSSRAHDLGARAYQHASYGDFDKAIAVYTQAIQLTPDDARFWLLRAMAELEDGQLDAYRRHCAEMLRYFGNTEKVAHGACDDVCWACTLAPDAVSDWSNALALADRAVKQCPEEAEYMLTRGAVLYRAGRWEEALRPLTEGHRRLENSSNPFLWLDVVRDCSYLAMAHHRLGHREEARKWFDKMKQQLEAALAEQRSGKVYFGWNIFEPIKLLQPEAARLLGISDADCLAIKARGLAASGDYAEAIAIMAKLVHDFPDSAEYREILASGYCCQGDAVRKQGDIDKALGIYKEAARLDPRSMEYCLRQIEILCTRALDFNDKGKFEQAIAACNEAIQLCPSDALPLEIRGKLYARPQHLNCDMAISDLTRALALSAQPTSKAIPHSHLDYFGTLSFESYFQRGQVYSFKHDSEEAIADFDKAIQIFSLGAHAFYRGEVYRQKGDLVRAVADYDHIISTLSATTAWWYRSITLPSAYYCRALCRGSFGQTGDAIRDIQAGDRLGSHHSLPLMKLAWCLATCPNVAIRDTQRAVKAAQEAVRVAPNCLCMEEEKGHYTILGVAQYRAGNWLQAIEAFNRSVDLFSGGDPCDWLFLAMAQWQLGHKDEARRWYDKADAWMNKNRIQEEELNRFRAEAAKLLGVATTQSPAKPQAEKVKPK